MNLTHDNDLAMVNDSDFGTMIQIVRVDTYEKTEYPMRFVRNILISHEPSFDELTYLLVRAQQELDRDQEKFLQSVAWQFV
jgi:hypothetical protein